MEGAPESLVIDASTVVKWFVPEHDTDEALKVRDRHVDAGLVLYAPDILVYEVANALRYRPDLEEKVLIQDLDALFSLDLELIIPSSRMVGRAALMARRLGITVYDSAYLILAETLGTTLVTGDQELFEKTSETHLVSLLRDIAQGL